MRVGSSCGKWHQIGDRALAVGWLALLPIFYMLAVNSTTVGISGKTTMLVMPVIILLILLSPARAKTG